MAPSSTPWLTRCRRARSCVNASHGFFLASFSPSDDVACPAVPLLGKDLLGSEPLAPRVVAGLDPGSVDWSPRVALFFALHLPTNAFHSAWREWSTQRQHSQLN